MRFVWVVVGSGLGGGARYLLSSWVLAMLGPAFPYGTLTVNALGSFLIGFIMQIGLTTNAISPSLRLFLTTGVLGGFTTYSTFNYETLGAFQQGAWFLGLLNLSLTMILCLGVGGLGLFCASWLTAS